MSLYIMTTFTNSEGMASTYTNELLEIISLQLNSSNNYYTTGEHDIIYITIGSNNLLLLGYTYYINRNIFQVYTVSENTVNYYELEVISNNTSNEYDVQSVYNGNGLFGVIPELSQVCLAIYDTNTDPFHIQDQEILILQITKYH